MTNIYWSIRAKLLGPRAVFNRNHQLPDLQRVTSNQKALLLSLLKKELTGREKLILDFGRGGHWMGGPATTSIRAHSRRRWGTGMGAGSRGSASMPRYGAGLARRSRFGCHARARGAAPGRHRCGWRCTRTPLAHRGNPCSRGAPSTLGPSRGARRANSRCLHRGATSCCPARRRLIKAVL
jgi:hypothetical protein